MYHPAYLGYVTEGATQQADKRTSKLRRLLLDRTFVFRKKFVDYLKATPDLPERPVSVCGYAAS